MEEISLIKLKTVLLEAKRLKKTRSGSGEPKYCKDCDVYTKWVSSIGILNPPIFCSAKKEHRY